MSMKVDLRVGESLRFNDGKIVVTLLEKSGQRARISVEADDSVSMNKVSEGGAMPEQSGISTAVRAKMLAGTV